MSKNILFISESLFKERTGASNAIDGKQIFPMIKVAQDIHIQPTLGTRLYKRLQEGIDANNLTINEKTLLDDYLTDSLIWYTMSMLPLSMGYQLFSKGFLQKTAEESNSPNHKDLELIEKQYKSMAEFYNTRMIWYLQENYHLYYEYINTGTGLDIIFPKTKAYTCPIYIGDTMERINPPYINSSSGGNYPQRIFYNAVGNETTFTIPQLVGREVLAAFRSGLNKGITTTATSNTEYLQINSGVITLPTGDIAMNGELFIFLFR